jgi:nitroreductase
MTELADGLRARYGVPHARAGAAVKGRAQLERMLVRRSHRRFKPEPIAEDLLAVLLACAQSAPTKSDLQQYAIIVVKDPELRDATAALLPGMAWARSAPLFLVFCADLRRSRRITELHGFSYANDNMDSYMNATVDAALAMQSFITAAEAAGLGCCPISAVRNRPRDFCQVLGLPSGVYPIAGLCVGEPAEEGSVSLRLPRPVVVHEDRYDDGRLGEALADYDRRRRAAQPIPPGRQRHTDRYGVDPACTWSKNVARQLSVPERAEFRRFLEEQGFALA